MNPEHDEQPDRIVINTEDLALETETPGNETATPIAPTFPTAPPTSLPPAPTSLPPAQTSLPPAQTSLPPVQMMPGAIAPTAGTGAPLAKLGANAVLSGLLAGAAGGLLGAIALEILYSPDRQSASSLAQSRLNSGIEIAIVGFVIGFALLSWEGFTTGSPQKGFRDGAIGGGIGAGAGFIGGYIAQVLFYELLKNVTIDELIDLSAGTQMKFRIARTGAWLIFGGLLGLGLGIRGGSRKAVNGLIGGVVGGAVGGLVFEQIELSAHGGGSGTVIRFVGFTITGIGIGVGIGLVERIRKDSWLVVAGGPMTGKEIILYKPVTTIGSDYRSDLVLVKDPAVAPQHIALTRDVHGNVTMNVAPGASATLNGMAVFSQQLRPGDLISVGASLLQYQQRALVSY